ncbi:hypothetical protein P261_02012 [Lachnospiraceae bacterium TWA4]|nr:hypothetical protein P261_02012 [Lachnospiraceae bacterium TWA4]
MKTFWIRVVNLLVIIGVLFGYNTVLAQRKNAETIAKLENELQVMQQQAEELGAYKDGTYKGEAQGFGGPIEVEAHVEKGKISAIDIVSAKKEDKAYLDAAKAIIESMIENQTADIDTISGATFSSTGIKNAVTKALEEAKNE